MACIKYSAGKKGYYFIECDGIEFHCEAPEIFSGTPVKNSLSYIIKKMFTAKYADIQKCL